MNRTKTQWIQWTVGAVLIAYALYGLLLKPAARFTAPVWAYLVGCLGGSISASGAPVIIYTSLQPWNKDQIKVTL